MRLPDESILSQKPANSVQPLPWRWRERAVQWLDFPLSRFLDYGCGACGLLEVIADRCEECHGVDVNESVLAAAREAHPTFELTCIGLDGKTPYPDGHFDTVALIEVIEHVPDEARTLAEIGRILKPGGRLLLTTPHAGLLTFLDLGNFKFLFPRTHRFIHRRVLRNKAYYEQRFSEGREKGLVGDISVAPDRKPWHRHYKPEQMLSFCPPTLELLRHEIYFPGMRAMMLLRTMLCVCTGGLYTGFPAPLAALERRLSRKTSRTGDQLVMLFQKREGP